MRITADNITLRAAAITGFGGALTLSTVANVMKTGEGHIILNANIAAGSNNLTITAVGRLDLATARAVALSGAAISLTATTKTPSSGSNNITVTGSGAVSISTNLDAGSGDIVLRAGDGAGTGDFTFEASRSLTAANVTLAQDSAFTGGSTAPIALPSSGVLTLAVEAAQTVQAWMAASGRSLALTAAGITVGGNITLGGGDLTLNAGTGAINFSTSAAVAISGADISLTAAAAPTASDQDLTITATGAVTVASNLNARDGQSGDYGGNGCDCRRYHI